MTELPGTRTDETTGQSPAAQIPRPLNPRARRRSWSELPVRVWVVLTCTVAAITLFFTITRVHETLSARWLILHGQNVVAKMTFVAGDKVPKRHFRDEPIVTEITFTLGGVTKKILFNLEPRPGAVASLNADFPIKVDPDNLDHWTEETEPKPWSQELTAVGLLLPVLCIVALIMLLKRAAILKTWRNGIAGEATVVELRHTPVAPLSRIIRFTLNDNPDRRIWTTLMPARSGLPSPGDVIQLIYPESNPGRAIVAKLYMEG